MAWRTGVGVLLLGWIFQAIFYHEGRLAWQQAGNDWMRLTKIERIQVAWTYGPPALWHTLTQMDLKYLVLSIVLMGVLLMVGVLRWQIILKVHGLDLPLARTTEISLIAHFFNSFLLGSVGGDLLKAYYAARETHHKKTEAVITVAVDRIIGLCSMLLLACGLLLFNRDLLLMINPRLMPVIWLIATMTAGCALLVFLSFWGGVTKGFPGLRQWMEKLPKWDMIERSIEAFREFGRDKTFFLRVLPIALLGNAVCILHFQTLIWGFHRSASLLDISTIVPIVTCISTLPITPSGLGVRENLYVWFLEAVNIPYAEALLISLVAFATSLFWSAIGGLVYMTVKKKEHLEEIESEDAKEPLIS